MLRREFDLFCHDPYPLRWQDLDVKTRILISIIITILPLFILSLFEGSALIFDATIYLRFFIAIPLFLLTPKFTGEKIKIIGTAFLREEIIVGDDVGVFKRLLNETHRLRDNPWIKRILFVVIYVLMVLTVEKLMPHLPPSWRVRATSEGNTLTLPGKWFFFVAQPLYYFIALYFMFQIALWWRLLFKISRMDLQIRAGHGDGCGGLAFLSLSIYAFSLPALALSSSAAGYTINLFLYQGVHIQEIKTTFTIITVVSFIIFVGPLFLFFPKMFQAKKKAALEYSIMSGAQIKLFEEKWTKTKVAPIKESLDAQDFSAVTDSLSIVAHARKMNPLPFTPKHLVVFFAAIFLPYIPLTIIIISWDEFLKKALQFLL